MKFEDLVKKLGRFLTDEEWETTSEYKDLIVKTSKWLKTKKNIFPTRSSISKDVR